jgi:type II secretory pathway component PulK
MKSRRRKFRRRAMLVVSVLVSLALVMMLMAAWLKVIALERQQLRAQQNRMQAEYLANSAMSRAAARLAANPDYDGETITASAESLAASAPANVTIEVETPADDPQARLITVSARFPSAGPHGVLRSKQQRTLVSTKEPVP